MTTATNVPTELSINRFFQAPIELVWEAWTDVKHLTEWWGPTHFTNPVCEADVRVGGRIRIHMKAPDGTIYPMGGEYLIVEPPTRLKFGTSPTDLKGNVLFEMVTTVVFTSKNGGTAMDFHTEVISMTDLAPQFLAGMEVGWNQSLDRLASLLAHL